MSEFAAFKKVSRVEVAGMDGLIFYFDGGSLMASNQLVNAYQRTIEAQAPKWLQRCLPSYDTLMVTFNPLLTDNHEVYHVFHDLTVDDTKNSGGKRHNLPVWYDAPGATDLEALSVETGLTKENIINIHSSHCYRVFAVGFAPGFAYLGESPQALNVPRRTTPRTEVPAGAVAIADRQSAVYPHFSPGGWNLLGLCPSVLFDINRKPPGRLNAGDEVCFYAISETEFREYKDE